MTVVELGCGNQIFNLIIAGYVDSASLGAGNSVFPLLSSNKNADLHIHAYDYSSHAVKLVQVCPVPLCNNS